MVERDALNTGFHWYAHCMHSCTMDAAHPGPEQQMVELARQYRHTREEHERQGSDGSRRRRIKQDMQRIAQHYERLIEHWVPDDPARQAWRAHLYEGAEAPEQPPLAQPPLFRGTTEAGALLEIHEVSGGYDLLIDGKLVEHGEIPWHLDPERVDPVQIQDWTCKETFASPNEAVAAFEAFLKSGGSPPWEWARVLYEDGLIDADFGLTPRGARRLGTEAPEAVVEHERVNFCVIVADSARARVYTLKGASSLTEPSLKPLELAADLSDQRRRARDAERFSETRPGMRREGPHGPRHTVSDLREEHRRETTKQFATYVLDQAARVWNGFDSCRIVLCANPQMLGILRPLIAHKLGSSSPHHVQEFQRELTPLDTRRVREALAQAGLLPARGRRAPLTPLATIQPKEKPAREEPS